MCAASSPPPPVPLATWNPARGVWEETPQVSLLCGHSVPYSDPWPSSGTTRSGSCFAPPTSGPRTAASGPSSPHGPPGTLLKTPTSNIGKNGGRHPSKRKSGGHGPNLADEVEWLLLPTPKASDGIKGSPNQRHGNGDMTLPSAAASLLPTPRASDTGTPGRRPGKGWRPPLSAVACPSGRRRRRRRGRGPAMGSVRIRHHPMGEPHPPGPGPHGRGRSALRGLRGVDAGPRRRLGHRDSGARPSNAAHRARQRRRPATGGARLAVAGTTLPPLSPLHRPIALHYRVLPAGPNR